MWQFVTLLPNVCGDQAVDVLQILPSRNPIVLLLSVWFWQRAIEVIRIDVPQYPPQYRSVLEVFP